MRTATEGRRTLARVTHTAIECRRLPLRNPYVLSFATLEAFDVLFSTIRWDDDTCSVGEVVPLPGYSEETLESTRLEAKRLSTLMQGRRPEEIRTALASALRAHPCAVSLWLSAVDAFLLQKAPAQPLARPVPLAYAVSSEDSDLEERVMLAGQQGFQTIKCKIGKDLETDLQALPRLRRSLHPGSVVRFDANQGYDRARAQQFLRACERELPGLVELVEQPLAPEAWDEMARLPQETAIPLMLDESIRDAEDVERAARIGCRWIKLKLCKQGGIEEVIALAQRAKRLGLKVVLGNGVATDVANYLELMAYAGHPHLFDGASESNGFAKLRHCQHHPGLSVCNGYAVCLPAAA